MSELVHRLYGVIHLTAKRLLGRKVLGVTPGIHPFAIRRINERGSYENLWLKFIKNSKVEGEVIHYAGYSEDLRQWSLPSWVWTNAAIVRCMSRIDSDYALELADALIHRQQECGGWIVRNDYDKTGAIPVLAPNDSAYIANNAMLEAYFLTADSQYLEAAQRCANWIIETARPDGIVYVGYNSRDEFWEKSCVIVDVGFTAGLFARLYQITHEDKYRVFLERFVNRYVDLFFNKRESAFCTSVNANDDGQGGFFGRGQAWALEGLIPAYKVLEDRSIASVIEATVANIMRNQSSDGGWPYNFAQPLMGQDCKGVALLARSLADWYEISGNEECRKSAELALRWCERHTSFRGDGIGGIYSYTIEGGIVKNLYSSCAFVYASAYALELRTQIEKYSGKDNNID